MIVSGQNSTVCLLYSPTDKGIGFRYDKQINNVGIYGSACRGSYWVSDGVRINNHVKLSTGFVKYVPNMIEKVINVFSLGVSFHSYGTVKGEYIPTPDHLFFPVSVEAGVGFLINHFNIGWCYDPLKKEVVVNSGYYF